MSAPKRPAAAEDAYARYDHQAKSVMGAAVKLANDLKHRVVGTQHLLHAICESKDFTRAGKIFAQYSLVPVRVRSFITLMSDRAEEAPSGAKIYPGGYIFSTDLLRCLAAAQRFADDLGSPGIDVDHLALGLISDPDCNAYAGMEQLGVRRPEAIRDALLEQIRSKPAAPVVGRTAAPAAHAPAASAPTAAPRQAVPAGEEGGRQQVDPVASALIDLVAQAGSAHGLDSVIGREREIRRMIEILARRKKNNPVLVGEPGVGKTAVVEGLAKAISEQLVPAFLRSARIYALDVTALVAGTKYRGDFEERMRKIIEFLRARKDAILFIDELHTIIAAGRGGDGSLDVANILKPYLARGEIRCIGSTTYAEYRRYVEKDAALERRFQQVKIEEPSEAETLGILRGVRSTYAEHHRVVIADEALETAVRLSERYLTERHQPDKAIDLLDEACARARMSAPDAASAAEAELREIFSAQEAATNAGDMAALGRLGEQERRVTAALERARTDPPPVTVGADAVVAVLQEWTSIPAGQITADDRAGLRDLESRLGERIIGQDDAVAAVARAVRRGRLGMSGTSRPVASLLFVGPSGTGKTALAKALAELVYGGEHTLLRFDMSEYGEKHAVARLIGAPPGYLGHDQGGQLTDALRKRPHTVVLFDEIDKAAPDVLNVLLQILDEGMITDGRGAQVSARSAVIIMTTNAGSREAAEIETQSGLGFRPAAAPDERSRESAKARGRALDRLLLPELQGRIDAVVDFRPLGPEAQQRIVQVEIAALAARLRTNPNCAIELSVGPALQAVLLRDGFTRKHGARPLREALARLVEDPIGLALLDGVVPVGSAVLADLGANGSPRVNVIPPDAPATPAPVELAEAGE